MKRWSICLPAALLALSLAACGNGGNGGAGQTYQVGDTVTSENWELTVTDVVCGTNLETTLDSDDYLLVDGDFDTEIYLLDGSTTEKAYVAEEGRAYVVVAYDLTYTGKEATTYNQQMSIDYNDGYLYEEHPYINSDFELRGEDGTFQGQTYYDVEPLSGTYEIRSCFDVPEDVMTNTEAPLSVVIALDGQEYTYTVR